MISCKQDQKKMENKCTKKRLMSVLWICTESQNAISLSQNIRNITFCVETVQEWWMRVYLPQNVTSQIIYKYETYFSLNMLFHAMLTSWVFLWLQHDGYNKDFWGHFWIFEYYYIYFLHLAFLWNCARVPYI